MAGRSGAKQRGADGKFKTGNTGRPKGARHKVTLAIEALLDGQAEALTQRAIEMALAGDIVAMRLCLDRLAPVRKDRPVTFALPKIETAADLPKATSAIMKAVAGGELTPSEAAELGKLIDAHAKAIEVTEMHRRLEALEESRS